MKWQVELSTQAKKQLDKLDAKTAKRITDFLERLEERDNPRGLGEALKGSKLGDFWKYRVGAYRVIAEIKDAVITIIVVKISRRDQAYKDRS